MPINQKKGDVGDREKGKVDIAEVPERNQNSKKKKEQHAAIILQEIAYY